jgi:hypothetical protein
VQNRFFGCLVAVFTFFIGSHLLAGPATNPSTQPTAEGLIIEQRITMTVSQFEQPPQKVVLKFKGRQMRMDSDQMFSTIAMEDGTMVTLMHMNRSVMTTSVGLLKEGMERGASALGTAETVPKLTPTGEKQMIGDYEAEAYTFRKNMFGQEIETKMWLAPEYPDSERIKTVQQEFAKANPVMSMTANIMPGLSPSDFPKGMVVRIESDMPNVGKMTVDTVSAKFAAIDDSEFVVPKDYQQAAMPMAPTGP